MSCRLMPARAAYANLVRGLSYYSVENIYVGYKGAMR